MSSKAKGSTVKTFTLAAWVEAAIRLYTAHNTNVAKAYIGNAASFSSLKPEQVERVKRGAERLRDESGGLVQDAKFVWVHQTYKPLPSVGDTDRPNFLTFFAQCRDAGRITDIPANLDWYAEDEDGQVQDCAVLRLRKAGVLGETGTHLRQRPAKGGFILAIGADADSAKKARKGRKVTTSEQAATRDKMLSAM